MAMPIRGYTRSLYPLLRHVPHGITTSLPSSLLGLLASHSHKWDSMLISKHSPQHSGRSQFRRRKLRSSLVDLGVSLFKTAELLIGFSLVLSRVIT